MPTTKKANTIDELSDALGRSQLTIVTDYRGLSVTDLQGFRAALRSNGAEFRVAKNTLTTIAATRAGVEGFDGMLEGPTGLVIVHEDIVGASKAVNDFVRISRVLTVKGAVMNNRALTASDIEELATLPSREELQAKLLGMLVSPMSRTLGVLGGPARSLVYVLNAKAGQGEAAAAD
jgi:large subunit ribosomal protein L10